jgi:hypothetical protein
MQARWDYQLANVVTYTAAMDDDPRAVARARLRTASARHAKLKAAVGELHDAIVEAAAAGLTPTEIVDLSDFSREGTRKVLRRGGVAPSGRRGPRPAPQRPESTEKD